MAGYSGTPLPRKLGIKPQFRVSLGGMPAEVKSELKDGRLRREPRSTRFRHAVREKPSRADETVRSLSRQAAARGHAVGELAEKILRSSHRSNRRRSAQDRPRGWLSRREGLRRQRSLVRPEIRAAGERPLGLD